MALRRVPAHDRADRQAMERRNHLRDADEGEPLLRTSRAIPGISDWLLAERLKELEDAGIVTREVEPTRPPQVSYALTTKGHALARC